LGLLTELLVNLGEKRQLTIISRLKICAKPKRTRIRPKTRITSSGHDARSEHQGFDAG